MNKVTTWLRARKSLQLTPDKPMMWDIMSDAEAEKMVAYYKNKYKEGIENAQRSSSEVAVGLLSSHDYFKSSRSS